MHLLGPLSFASLYRLPFSGLLFPGGNTSEHTLFQPGSEFSEVTLELLHDPVNLGLAPGTFPFGLLGVAGGFPKDRRFVAYLSIFVLLFLYALFLGMREP